MDHIILKCRRVLCRQEFRKLAPNQVYCSRECAPFADIPNPQSLKENALERLRNMQTKHAKMEEYNPDVVLS